jgi:hypothetical protein
VRRTALTLALLGGMLLAVPARAGTVPGNPADDRRLLDQPIDAPRYDDAHRCLKHPQRGTLALQAWLSRDWPGVSWGIMRCEKLSADSYSLHSEGRALDWHLDAAVPAQKHAAMRLIAMLLASDRDGNETALARRMGVQGIIFNCHAWFGWGDRLGPYS